MSKGETSSTHGRELRQLRETHEVGSREAQISLGERAQEKHLQIRSRIAP